MEREFARHPSRGGGGGGGFFLARAGGSGGENAAVDRLDLPPGAVTGVGSLPGSDPAAALEWVARWAPELPFWPQLPARSDMLAEGESDHPPPGLAAFLERARAGGFPAAVALKGQVVGPCTLALARGLGPEAGSELAALGARLAALAARQVALLRACGRPALLWIDEPGLGAWLGAAPPGSALSLLRPILEAVRAADGWPGIHTCAPPPWELLLTLEPELVSFDAWRDLEAAASDPACRELVARGAWLGVGLVPTTAPLEGLRAAELFRRLWLAWSRLGERVAARTLVTASCGLGLRPPAEVAASFGLARALGAWVRRVAR